MIVTYMQVRRISISSHFLFLIIQLFEPKCFLLMTIDVCSYKSFTRTRFNRWTQGRLREIVCGDCVLTRTIKMWNCSKNECMVYHILYRIFYKTASKAKVKMTYWKKCFDKITLISIRFKIVKKFLKISIIRRRFFFQHEKHDLSLFTL